MASIRSLFLATGLATLIQAYTQPTTATWGALLTPNLSDPVTQGTTAQVTWDPTGHATDGVTVSLVLCHGPSTNCVPATDAIVSGLPAAQKSYSWAVPCSLAPGTAATDSGYGMLIIVDQTGEFQYSTQFSVLANAAGCSASTSSSASSSTPYTTGHGPVVTSTTSTAAGPSSWTAWGGSSPAPSVSSSTWSNYPMSNSTSAMWTTHVPASVPTTTKSSSYHASGTGVSTTSSSLVAQFSNAAVVQRGMEAVGVIGAAAVALFAL